MYSFEELAFRSSLLQVQILESDLDENRDTWTSTYRTDQFTAVLDGCRSSSGQIMYWFSGPVSYFSTTNKPMNEPTWVRIEWGSKTKALETCLTVTWLHLSAWMPANFPSYPCTVYCKLNYGKKLRYRHLCPYWFCAISLTLIVPGPQLFVLLRLPWQSPLALKYGALKAILLQHGTHIYYHSAGDGRQVIRLPDPTLLGLLVQEGLRTQCWSYIRMIHLGYECE